MACSHRRRGQDKTRRNWVKTRQNCLVGGMNKPLVYAGCSHFTGHSVGHLLYITELLTIVTGTEFTITTVFAVPVTLGIDAR